MQFGAEFSRFLPELRRHARAVCGVQQAGDDLVVATLERLTKSDVVPKDLPPKAALFAILTELMNGPVGKSIITDTNANVSTATSVDRQAFLLTSVEQFDKASTSRILGLSTPELSEALDKAYKHLAEEAPAEVLVIEDEFFIAMDLDQILSDLGHHVAALARTRTEANKCIRETNPDLVLADIHLADGSSGIDAARDILEIRDVPIVFVTAYPERLLTGLEPEPTYLVTKPFSRSAIQATVSQALYKSRTDAGRPTTVGKNPN
ncbi:MAG: response regulator [Pseudomonadota bacterium]